MSRAGKAPLVALLAAGAGRRFGGGKLDAPCAGRALGRWALDAAMEAGVTRGIIITGPTSTDLARYAESLGWRTVQNPLAEDGMGSSVAAAARDAMAQDAPALLVLLADMPLIPASAIADLLSTPEGRVAATLHPDGKPGVPACFPAALFPALAALKGDRGAGALLTGRPDIIAHPLSAEALLDVDDPAALKEAERLLLLR